MFNTFTKELFRKSPNFQVRLAEILEDPVFVTALALISEGVRPRKRVDFQAGVPLDTSISHHYLESKGAQKAIDDLFRLSQPWVENEAQTETEAPFFHGLPLPYRQAIQKLNQPNQA